jgi:hypothetical protein
MFKFILSYHQVMPSFLDFVFPFGKQVYPQDVHFSGLREDSCFDLQTRGAALSGLGRSGNGIQMCYNLRSVEPTNDQSSLLQWSIRQAAVCHHFDTETATTLWIIVKANKLIKNRFGEAAQESSRPRPSTLADSFNATLTSHLLICDWSGENWRWYINDLEEKFQNLTDDVFVPQMEKETSPVSPMSPSGFFMSPRTRTSSIPPLSPSATLCSSPKNDKGSFSPKSRSSTFDSWRISRAPNSGGNLLCTPLKNGTRDGDTHATRTNTADSVVPGTGSFPFKQTVAVLERPEQALHSRGTFDRLKVSAKRI